MPEQKINSEGTLPKLYRHLASWWPLLSAPDDYAAEAEFYRKTLESACSPHSVLELGCGGGNNASHLKAHFDMTLVDISAEMLEVSVKLNPECRHVQGDMRTLRMGEVFDAVFVHDAVSYMTTESDLRAAIQTTFEHCRPGGAALFAPDFTKETFSPSTHHGGHDGEGRALRYLAWMWDPDPSDTTFNYDMVYLLRHADGEITVEHDRHMAGLFPRAVWLDLMTQTGFQPQVVTTPHGEAAGGCEVFLALRPKS